jgi:hypothetical protein
VAGKLSERLFEASDTTKVSKKKSSERFVIEIENLLNTSSFWGNIFAPAIVPGNIWHA